MRRARRLEALDTDERMRGHVLRRGIRQCLDLTYAAAEGQTIWRYAPRSRAAEDYTALVATLREELPEQRGAGDDGQETQAWV